MNFRTNQICLSSSDSEHVIPQHETETTHVSNFQLLHSQPVGLGHLVELLTNGVEPPGDIHAEHVPLPLMPLKFCRCFSEQTCALVFQCVACDTIHLI